MGYLSRRPTSNDLSRADYDKSSWLGENEFMDEFALLLNGYAKRCIGCKRATNVRYLNSTQRCPDCCKEEKE